jgi:hypothetical protein
LQVAHRARDVAKLERQIEKAARESDPIGHRRRTAKRKNKRKRASNKKSNDDESKKKDRVVSCVHVFPKQNEDGHKFDAATGAWVMACSNCGFQEIYEEF